MTISETPGPRRDAGLISAQLGLVPPGRHLQPPADLFAFLGTTRQPLRYPPAISPWWCRLDQLPLGSHWHNPGPAPILRARRDRRTLYVWCRYCRQHHGHGAHTSLCGTECACPLHTSTGPRAKICLCPVGSADGHRGAHCWNPRSPYKATGYVLREVGQ